VGEIDKKLALIWIRDCGSWCLPIIFAKAH